MNFSMIWPMPRLVWKTAVLDLYQAAASPARRLSEEAGLLQRKRPTVVATPNGVWALFATE
jgi:hypothetical protein